MATREISPEQGQALEDGSLFERLVDSWRRLGRLAYDERSVAAAGSLARAQGLRYMTRYLSAGSILAMELGDPDYPYFDRWADRSYSWGLNNPDTIYSFAAIRGDASYRIYGDRGSCHHLDLQVHAPHFCAAPKYRIVAGVDWRQLAWEEDGSIEIVLSPDRHPGNWVELQPDAGSLCVRQYFYDWESERPANLSIERVGASYPPPPESPAQIATQAELLMAWMDRGASFWDAMVRNCLNAPPNSSPFLDPGESEWGGLRGLSYGLGNYHCRPDEAVILEVTPPRCHYWSFQLATVYWESMDWWRRQTSINGHAAVLDPDGVFRAVIAHRDPGVPNWLDAGGHEVGLLNGRYLLSKTLPEPSLRVVRFADLRRSLPESTRSVTPEERSESLRRRQRFAQKRDGL